MLRRSIPVLLLSLFAAGSSGCKKSDPEKCDNALKVARQSADIGDSALTRQWREYAYKHCSDRSALEALDKELVDKEKAALQKKAEQEAKQREIDQLVQIFVDWVSQHRTDPARSSSRGGCQGPEDTKDRWCTRQRSVSDKYPLTARFWEAEPAAVQFSLRAPGDVSCDKLGSADVKNTLSGGARTHCVLTGGLLSGMQVLTSRTPEGSIVAVFSSEYVERDAGLKALLSG
jgi:hypothetical protein